MCKFNTANESKAIEWISTVIAVIGVILNNYKITMCFLFWIISNSTSAIIHFKKGLYGFFVRDIIFLGLAIYGLILWS